MTKRLQAHAPTGSPILGTYEMCPARSEIAYFYRQEDGSLMWEHEGSSEMFYDGMQTVERDTPAGKRVVFLDADGEEWTEDQVTFSEED